MKKLIALIVLTTIAVPKIVLGAWTIDYDNGGGLRYSTNVDGSSFLFFDTADEWKATDDSGSTYEFDQAAIDLAYSIDPTTLPTNSGASGATDGGFNWPCDWSQYSEVCEEEPPPEEEEPVLPDPPDYSTTTAASAELIIQISLSGLIIGAALGLLLVFFGRR